MAGTGSTCADALSEGAEEMLAVGGGVMDGSTDGDGEAPNGVADAEAVSGGEEVDAQELRTTNSPTNAGKDRRRFMQPSWQRIPAAGLRTCPQWVRLHYGKCHFKTTAAYRSVAAVADHTIAGMRSVVAPGR